MTYGSRFIAASALSVSLAGGTPVRADGASDLRDAFRTAFSGVEACATLRDVAPDAQPRISDPIACGRRLPPCATFDIPASVVALDRGVVPDANAPVKRTPAAEGDPPNGMNLRDAFRTSARWVYEEVSRRIGSDVIGKALATMRYGNAQAQGPVERLGRGDESGLELSPVEQIEFLARLKRGELPTSAESQARTVEIVPTEQIGDASVAMKSGACDSVAWAVGWVDQGRRSTAFAVAVTGQGVSADDTAARAKKLLATLGLTGAPPAR